MCVSHAIRLLSLNCLIKKQKLWAVGLITLVWKTLRKYFRTGEKIKMDEKIKFKEKVSYTLLNIGNIPVTMIVSSFLLIFYTNVVGLNPAACATLFLIARIVDAVNDPLVGFLIDRIPNTKLGHFRATLIVGAVLCGINYLLLWFGPLMVPAGKLAIAYVSYFLLGVLFPVMDISLNSLLPVMTENPKERNSLSTIKGMTYSLAGLVIRDFGSDFDRRRIFT